MCNINEKDIYGDMVDHYKKKRERGRENKRTLGNIILLLLDNKANVSLILSPKILSILVLPLTKPECFLL